MSSSVELITKNEFGKLTFCKDCKDYTLCFANFIFKFSKKEFSTFKNYINDVPVSYWENTAHTLHHTRKIPIHTKQQNLTLVFTRQEFNRLKSLLSGDNNETKLLSILDIDYPLSLN